MATTTSAELMAAARSAIRYISLDDAKPLVDDPNTVFVDVRDSKELSDSGTIPGALHVPRGGLEFALDAASDFAMPELTSGKQLVLVCGSGARATFATKLAQDLGQNAICLEGGFKAWKASGAPVNEVG